MPTPGSSKENIDGAGAKAEPKSADSKDSSKKEKPPPPRTPEEKYADLVKKYNDLVANYKARGVAGDELRARLTQVEEELVEENERFQETEYRLKKANDEIEVLTALVPDEEKKERKKKKKKVFPTTSSWRPVFLELIRFPSFAPRVKMEIRQLCGCPIWMRLQWGTNGRRAKLCPMQS